MGKGRSSARKPAAAEGGAPAMFAAADGGGTGVGPAPRGTLKDARQAQRAAPGAPADLGSIIGQDRAVAALRGVLASGRVHHCWVFHGPEGVGKLAAARAFASALLTPAPGDTSPAAGAAREALAGGSHPDLHVITRELARHSRDKDIHGRKLVTIPKQVIEEFLLEPAARRRWLDYPSVAGKVFIVDEAERLDRSQSHAPTQASMLKLLEEPPEGMVIILVTSAEEHLLPTVRSRSQRLAFGPLDAGAMERWLGTPAAARVSGLAPVERAWLLEHAGGSPGALLEAMESGLHAWAKVLGPELEGLARGTPSVTMGAKLAGLVEDFASAWARAWPEYGKDVGNRMAAKQMLSVLARWCAGQLTRGGPPGASPERWAAALDLLHEAERQIDASVAAAAVLENAIAQISAVAGAGRPPALSR